MKYLSLAALLLSFLILLPGKVAAAANCVPIFGGGETCTNNNLTLQKQVLNPKTNLFVHDLGLSDPKYHGNDLVTFQLTLTNTSNTDNDNIVVKDILPSQLNFSDGPGKFDSRAHELTFTIPKLVAHHSQVFTINTTVISQDQFPQVENPFCFGNMATATPTSGPLAQDSSQLCVERITSTPSTGPDALGLLGLIPTALLGLSLRRFRIS